MPERDTEFVAARGIHNLSRGHGTMSVAPVLATPTAWVTATALANNLDSSDKVLLHLDNRAVPQEKGVCVLTFV